MADKKALRSTVKYNRWLLHQQAGDPIWVSWSDSYTGCDILLVTSGLVEKVSAGSWNLITIFEDQFALYNGYQGVEIEP